jgi:DNA-binding Lrp family transcriptional regulator
LKFDDTDLAIIKALRADARRTFRSIAEELGLSPNTVKSRFIKMRRYGLIKGSTVTIDIYELGAQVTQFCIRTVESETDEVIKHINEIRIGDRAIGCWKVLGHYNILAWLIIKDPVKLQAAKQIVRQHPGVIEVNVSILTNHMLLQDNIEVRELKNKVRS